MLFVDKSKVQEPFSRVRLHAEPSSSCFDLMKVHHLKHEWKCHELQNNPLHSDLEICGRSWLGYAALGLAQLMEFTRTADATQQLKGEELSERIGKNDALLPKVENERSPYREIVICCHVPNKHNEPTQSIVLVGLCDPPNGLGASRSKWSIPRRFKCCQDMSNAVRTLHQALLSLSTGVSQTSGGREVMLDLKGKTFRCCKRIEQNMLVLRSHAKSYSGSLCGSSKNHAKEITSALSYSEFTVNTCIVWSSCLLYGIDSLFTLFT